jgi:hypothetical protein
MTHGPYANIERRDTYVSGETLAACKEATNCELYEDPVFGTRIRFVKGMEPGSEHCKREVAPLSLGKRQGATETHITLGDGSISYGNVGASGTYGIIHHLYDICHEGLCDRNAFGLKSRFAGATSEYEDTVYLHASGQYNGWDERNIFVEALTATAGQGEKCEGKQWMHGGFMSGVESGTVKECQQTNYISFNRFVNKNLQGFMEVAIERRDRQGGWCGGILAILGGLSSIIATIPGAGLAGGASGFFGAMSPICS